MLGVRSVLQNAQVTPNILTERMRYCFAASLKVLARAEKSYKSDLERLEIARMKLASSRALLATFNAKDKPPAGQPVEHTDLWFSRQDIDDLRVIKFLIDASEMVDDHLAHRLLGLGLLERTGGPAGYGLTAEGGRRVLP